MQVFSGLNDELARTLLAGAVGVLPTDTVYGVVASARNAEAVRRFYALKRRDHKPGTIIAASIDQLVDLGVELRFLQRVRQWWPNPLSIETPIGPELAYLHQDTGRQALRVVADVELKKFLERSGPLVTSSANRPGEPGSVTVDQAKAYFNDAVDFYVDGGDLSGRPPSTIIRITDAGIEIIRQGAIGLENLKPQENE